MQLRLLCTHAHISARVRYSSAVVVIGQPLLELRMGAAVPAHVHATYVSGSGTGDLIFEYIVSPGDGTVRLHYDGQSALTYPTVAEAHAAVRTMKDLATDADPTMPEAWSANQLGVETHIQARLIAHLYACHRAASTAAEPRLSAYANCCIEALTTTRCARILCAH
jgi:hypothetical protein